MSLQDTAERADLRSSSTSPVHSRDTVEVPRVWLNLLPLLPQPLPEVRDPDGEGESRIDLQRRIRLRTVLEQDQLTAATLEIPEPVRQCYAAAGRPTPLTRAVGLESYLDTPAHIYLKREDVLPTGSFKLNSAIAQAYLAKQEGVRTLVTETGAGQWGHAVAYACRLFELECVVFWAGISALQKPGRAAVIRMLGAEVHRSPSAVTSVGRAIRDSGRHGDGSLGTAIGEAISYAADHPEVRYISGSNVPHVLLHQTVIGQETKAQLGERPDALVACVGGGSNLGGFIGPFLEDKREREDLVLIGAESASAPRLTQGQWRYDHADPLGVTPLTKSYTLGREYELPATHIGGLRQHNGSPVIGVLRASGLLEAVAYEEKEIFETGQVVLQTEHFLPAPESCHAIRAAMDRAEKARLRGRAETIVACVSGSGLLDLDGYIDILGYDRELGLDATTDGK
jgi:pyridoxal-phosphate dependent TrpB-like enzyme